jgi:hypothetical protein
MKHKKLRTTVKTIMAVTLGSSLLFAQPVLALGTPSKIHPNEEEPAAKKSKSKSKTFGSLNNGSVKIYPDAIKKMMHVVAKESAKKEVDFFVFDMQGTLLKNFKLKAKDHIKLEGLAKGIYTYRVFSGDEETAAGNFEIR